MPRILLALICFLYVLSPIDFIPDVIPIVGWLDDIGVLAYLGYTLFTPYVVIAEHR